MRTTRGLGILIVGILTLAACGGNSGSGQGGEGDTDEVDSITLAVGGMGSAGYLGFFVTEGLGLLEKCLESAGVKVEVQGFSGSTDAVQALVSGQADFATAGLGQVAQVSDGGRDAVALMAFSGGNVQVIGASSLPDDVTIEDAGDLTWGVGSIGSVGHQQSMAIARANGLDPDKVDFVAIGGAAGYVASLESGQVDLVTAGEPYASQLVHDGIGRLLIDFYDQETVEDAYPGGLVTTVLLTSDKFREANPNTTQAVVSAVLKGQEAAHDLSAEEVAEAVPDIADGHDAYWATALRTLLQSIPKDGQITEGAAENVLAGEKDGGRIEADSSVKAQDIYTNEYVEAAAAKNAC